MRGFTTGQSYEEKLTNWKYLQRIFKQYETIPLKDELVLRILNQAPNAAFEFLCIIFKYFTKKEYANY